MGPNTMEDGAPNCAVRVAKQYLENYTGRNVRLVGKVISNDGANAVLEDAMGEQVNISSVSGPYQSQYVEIIGAVQPDSSIETMHTIEYGDDFNMANYKELLQLAHGGRLRALFE